MNFITKDYILNNIERVLISLAEYDPFESCLVGYVYEPNGCYRTYYLKNSIENIILFLISDDKDKLICNGSDEALIFTFCKDICVCTYLSFAKELEKALKDVKRRNVTAKFETVE